MLLKSFQFIKSRTKLVNKWADFNLEALCCCDLMRKKRNDFQAHACLSDKTKRKSFNSERWKNFCKECYKKSQFMSSGNHCNFRNQRAFYPTEQQAKSDRMMNTLKEVQNRLREECGVIENCLRANKASRKEFPIFNPSKQLLYSPGYPHYQTRVFKKPMDCWYYHTNDARKYWERGGRCESPIYEIRTENQSMRTKNFSFSFWILDAPLLIFSLFYYSSFEQYFVFETSPLILSFFASMVKWWMFFLV